MSPDKPDKPVYLKVNLENIPEELKSVKNWVVWRGEKNKKGKWTKKPYNPRTGGGASSTNSATWTDFDTAVSKYENMDFDGIGIVLTDSPFAGFDFDHCIDDSGKINDQQKAWMNMVDTYTEISPSGTGVRGFFTGRIPPGRRKFTKLDTEIYETGRYLTVTGHKLNDRKVESREQEIMCLHQELMGSVKKDSVKKSFLKPSSPSPDFSDQELIEKMSKALNGSKFQSLWNGNTAGYATTDNNGDSEADLALCGILAFWTGRDEGRIDSLFRQSGLNRRKWDEKRGSSTYGRDTIAKAVSSCAEIYSPACSDLENDDISWVGDMLTGKGVTESNSGECAKKLFDYYLEIYSGDKEKVFSFLKTFITKWTHPLTEASLKNLLGRVETEQQKKKVTSGMSAHIEKVEIHEGDENRFKIFLTNGKQMLLTAAEFSSPAQFQNKMLSLAYYIIPLVKKAVWDNLMNTFLAEAAIIPVHEEETDSAIIQEILTKAYYKFTEMAYVPDLAGMLVSGGLAVIVYQDRIIFRLPSLMISLAESDEGKGLKRSEVAEILRSAGWLPSPNNKYIPGKDSVPGKRLRVWEIPEKDFSPAWENCQKVSEIEENG